MITPPTSEEHKAVQLCILGCAKDIDFTAVSHSEVERRVDFEQRGAA